jgi:tryptophanyl-tRNA synthetase
MSDKPTLVSGIQPSGNLHIGNYLGAVKNWVDLQKSGDYNCVFFIADYHTLTTEMGPKKRRNQIHKTAAELIAAGIDPDESLFFIQSEVPEHTELKWIFDCVAPVGELRRMTQFKDKAGIDFESIKEFASKKISEFNEKQEVSEELLKDRFIRIIQNVIQGAENKANAGLFTYPVLQAADILLYHGETVPVGEDQVQHLELTRDIARKFNNRFGTDYFPKAEPELTETPRVKSLREPESKMSKSKGADHVIELADETNVIEEKVKKAVTATEGGGEDIAPGVKNLLLLLEKFGDDDTYEEYLEKEKSGEIKYGYLKQEVSSAVADYFAGFRERRAELLEDRDQLAEILLEGSKQAQEIASNTIEEVRELVGVR